MYLSGVYLKLKFKSLWVYPSLPNYKQARSDILPKTK